MLFVFNKYRIPCLLPPKSRFVLGSRIGPETPKSKSFKDKFDWSSGVNQSVREMPFARLSFNIVSPKSFTPSQSPLPLVTYKLPLASIGIPVPDCQNPPRLPFGVLLYTPTCCSVVALYAMTQP